MIPANCYTARLYNTLDALIDIARQQNTMQGGQALNKVFNLNPGDRLKQLECWADMIYMTQKAKEEIDSSLAEVGGTDGETFQEIVSAIKDFPFDAQITNFTNKIPSARMIALRAYGLMLMRSVDVKIIDREDLLRFKTEVSELIAEVHESELPNDLKRFILKHLELIDIAITKYQIWGQDGFVDAINQNFGAALNAQGLFQQHREEPKVKRYLSIVKTGIELFNSAVEVAKMIEQGSHVLLG